MYTIYCGVSVGNEWTVGRKIAAGLLHVSLKKQPGSPSQWVELLCTPTLHALLHRYRFDQQKAHPAPVFLLLSAWESDNDKRVLRSAHTKVCTTKDSFPSLLQENGGGRERHNPTYYKIRERRKK